MKLIKISKNKTHLVKAEDLRPGMVVKGEDDRNNVLYVVIAHDKEKEPFKLLLIRGWNALAHLSVYSITEPNYQTVEDEYEMTFKTSEVPNEV